MTSVEFERLLTQIAATTRAPKEHIDELAASAQALAASIGCSPTSALLSMHTVITAGRVQRWRIERWIGNMLDRWAQPWPERPTPRRDYTWRQRLAFWWNSRSYWPSSAAP